MTSVINITKKSEHVSLLLKYGEKGKNKNRQYKIANNSTKLM